MLIRQVSGTYSNTEDEIIMKKQLEAFFIADKTCNENLPHQKPCKLNKNTKI